MSLIGANQFEKKNEKPRNAGHRGFRGRFPENTMLALKEGVAAGATVLETDIQLAADNVVVMCHDVTTGRVFDKNLVVEDTPFHDGLDQLRTNDKFRQPMPTLHEVADMIINNEKYAHVLLMIDIKRSNEPRVIPHLRRTLEEVAPLQQWKSRCVLGVWRDDVMQQVIKDLPTLDVAFIGWEHRLARQFLEYEQTSIISMHYASYAVRGGQEIIDLTRAKGRKIYSWTINAPEAMKWAVAARIDGVITDYPDVYGGFVDSISDKDLYNEYFTSEPRKFYSYTLLLQMYSLYVAATVYLVFADNLPWLFQKH